MILMGFNPDQRRRRKSQSGPFIRHKICKTNKCFVFLSCRETHDSRVQIAGGSGFETHQVRVCRSSHRA